MNKDRHVVPHAVQNHSEKFCKNRSSQSLINRRSGAELEKIFANVDFPRTQFPHTGKNVFLNGVHSV